MPQRYCHESRKFPGKYLDKVRNTKVFWQRVLGIFYHQNKRKDQFVQRFRNKTKPAIFSLSALTFTSLYHSPYLCYPYANLPSENKALPYGHHAPSFIWRNSSAANFYLHNDFTHQWFYSHVFFFPFFFNRSYSHVDYEC